MKVFKKLILPLVVLLILVAGLVVYTIVSSEPETEEKPGSSTVNLIDGKKAVKLTVVSADAKNKIIINKTAVDGKDFYEVEGISLSEGQTFSQRRVSSYFESLTSFSADSSLTSGSDLAEFGLDKPSYSITVDNEDGSNKTILIGNDSLDGKSAYVAMKDSKDVYTVDIAKKTDASMDPSSLISNDVWNIAFKDVSDVVFKRKSGNLEMAVKLYYNEGTALPDYLITSPYNVKAGKAFIELINKVLDFEVTQYVSLTEDEIVKYGLKDPEYSFTLNQKFDEPKEIFISAESDGYYYGYTGDNKTKYFSISKDLMKELELPVKSLINKSVISFDPTEVRSITVKNGNEEPFKLEITVGYGDNLSSDASTVTLNKSYAKIITPEGRNFASVLFESIVNVDIEDIDQSAKPAYNSEFNIKIITTGYKMYNYDFVKRTDQTYYVFLDEEYTGFYVKSDELFKKESKDSYSYGIIGAYELLKQAIKDYADGKYEVKKDSKPAKSDDPSESVDPDASSNVDETVMSGDEDGTYDEEDPELTDNVNSYDTEENYVTEEIEDAELNG